MFMTLYRTVTPAYGRDYTSARTARDDWANGKDFIIQPEGKYINKPDADRAGFSINIRYNALRRITPAQDPGRRER